MSALTPERAGAWRRDPFVDPICPARPALFGEAPAAAERALATAMANGWTAALTYARGHTPDGDWQPARTKTREPLIGEDGRPLLTAKGRPRHREVVTDELLVVETVALRARRAPQAVVAVWVDGSFERAWVGPSLRTLNSDAFLAVLRAPG